MKGHYLVFMLLSVLILSSCAALEKNRTRSAYCNELNSKIIFSPSTTDTRKAAIQSAEEPRLQQAFDAHCE